MIKTVKNVGKIGEELEVTRGYALNFLIPQGFATVATIGAIKEAKIRARKYNKASVIDHSAMDAFIKEINGTEITIKSKASEKGSLFGSIREGDIAEALAKKISKSIDSEYIILEEPIKKTGEYEVEIVADGSKGKLKVKIEAEV